VQSPKHWAESVVSLPGDVDAILPLSIPALPTEVWNSHPQPLVERGLPVMFWCHQEHEEPDFWRWSATDFLRTLGVDTYLVQNNAHGKTILRSLGMRRFLRSARMVVFGEQNFPWNAHAIGPVFRERLGTEIIVRPLSDIRNQYGSASKEAIDEVLEGRLEGRYVAVDVAVPELRQAIETYLAIREILQQERAMAFGVNCYGELVVSGGRDVPCLAQCLLREEGYIACCDGDFVAMVTMILTSGFLDRPCMMSNLYPLSYSGALVDHFGADLSPAPAYAEKEPRDLARLNHCSFVGIVPPEMTPAGTVSLRDFGGTLEVKRNGLGCGIDGELVPGHRITAAELCFDAKRLVVTTGEVLETTAHRGMPHCERTALLEFADLPGFIRNISREHPVIVYGDCVGELGVLSGVLGLECIVIGSDKQSNV
jgi:L-fucose isomerase-like protein